MTADPDPEDGAPRDMPPGGHDADRSAATPAARLEVLPAAAFRVTGGANLGDTLADWDREDPPVEGDLYRLAPGVSALPLTLDRAPLARGWRVSGRTDAPAQDEPDTPGRPGDRVQMRALLTLLHAEGRATEIMLLRILKQGASGTGSALWAFPLSPVVPGQDYTLIRVEPPPEDFALTEIGCASFARGTRILDAEGRAHPVETLQPGMRLLTRDHGAQPLRHLGRATLRAEGGFAPVVIPAGALGNLGDLVVSQRHRLFVYLRERPPELPTAEVLIEARHLVDGPTIRVREGGYVDYFSLVFDRHEIVYAEGLPAESLHLSEATRARLPATLAEDIAERFPGLVQSLHFGTEARAPLASALRRLILPAPR